jgi:1,4-alpha-glucan branching enzyme
VASGPRRPQAAPQKGDSGEEERSLYHPYGVGGSYGKADSGHTTTVFPRDPRTGVQVWSGELGYPGDGNYCDFHKKRWPGGHRYWRVTGHNVDMQDKAPYYPQEAQARIQGHASHFVHLVYDALAAGFRDPAPPILCAPFDAELFGHWWFEGPLWLEAVARILHDYPSGIELISGSDYLAQYPSAGTIKMHEGSWGAEGNNQVWMNHETSWTYGHLYPAELYVREVATAGKWRETETGARIVRQMCRELLLLESSDWQFLITTGAARDYAELRFLTHNEQFGELKTMWQAFEKDGTLNEHHSGRLAAVEERDGVFPDIDPAFWSMGAKENGLDGTPQARTSAS